MISILTVKSQSINVPAVTGHDYVVKSIRCFIAAPTTRRIFIDIKIFFHNFSEQINSC